MATKICSKCKEEKNVEEFNRDKSHKDGRRSICKQCENIKKHKQYIKKRSNLSDDYLNKIMIDGFKKISIAAKERFKDKTKHPRYKGNIVICQYCKKEFETFPSRKTIFCSKECRNNNSIDKKNVNYTLRKAETKTSQKLKIKFCENCNKEFNAKRNETKCCSHKCSYELATTKRLIKCMNIQKNNIPLYDTLSSQIAKYEKVRRDTDNPDILNVQCAYCGYWFTPKRKQVYTRIACINGEQTGSGMFYCSDNCKSACPIFNQKKYAKGYKKASPREVDPLIRQLCFKRDNYTCKHCNVTIKEAQLHCHHISGVTQSPIEQNDLSNVITLCKNCHKELHKTKGCTYQDYQCS